MNNFDDSIDTAKNILYKGYNSTSMNMKLKNLSIRNSTFIKFKFSINYLAI